PAADVATRLAVEVQEATRRRYGDRALRQRDPRWRGDVLIPESPMQRRGMCIAVLLEGYLEHEQPARRRERQLINIELAVRLAAAPVPVHINAGRAGRAERCARRADVRTDHEWLARRRGDLDLPVVSDRQLRDRAAEVVAAEH